MLELRDVALRHGATEIVKRANLKLEKGRVLGLVGASGSGKTLLSLAILGLLPDAIRASGDIVFRGEHLGAVTAERLADLRGRAIGMVFQNTSAAFDPLMTIGAQLADLFMRHRAMSRRAAQDAARAIFRAVEWPDEIDPFDRYPHDISGGQRQRALIAMAIALEPDFIIADEPTASLDVTTAKAMLDLLQRLAREKGAALLIISHDLPALATVVDEIALLAQGEIDSAVPMASVHDGSAPEALRALFRTSLPPQKPQRPRGPDAAAVIDAKNVVIAYQRHRFALFGKRDEIVAVRDVEFEMQRGECLALVGESGSGKSTLARSLLGLVPRRSGQLICAGLDPDAPATARRLWQSVRLMFQDPFAAVDPNWTVRRIVAEPLALIDQALSRAERDARVRAILDKTGITPDMVERYPHQLSGGQLQRVTLARALVTEPQILILDEPLSALDADARGQILALLADLAAETGLSILLITHDLGVARAIADRVIVMKDGEIVETGSLSSVLGSPRAAYTAALVAASPVLDAARRFSADLAPRPPQG